MAQPHRFAELLARVTREVRLRQASEVCCGELTLEQFQTLREVGAGTPASIGALSEKLRVDLSTMSRNLALLERNGHIARARSAEDGRVVRVKLTAKGRRALESLRCDERDVLARIYQRLPQADRPRVLRALEALDASLQSGDAAAGCCGPGGLEKKAS